MVRRSEAKADLCGFEGAKPGARALGGSQEGGSRLTEAESAAAKGGSPAPFR